MFPQLLSTPVEDTPCQRAVDGLGGVANSIEEELVVHGERGDLDELVRVFHYI